MTTRPVVVIESPYKASSAEQREINIAYARAALADSLDRGEAPIAGHLLYTQVLDDDVPEQREHGINAHLAHIANASLVAVYDDLGVSAWMRQAVVEANRLGVDIDRRSIPNVAEAIAQHRGAPAASWDVSRERIRQDDAWGTPTQRELWRRMGHGSAAMLRLRGIVAAAKPILAEEEAKRICQAAWANGTGTFFDILTEEFFEAIAARDFDHLRAELIQVAATAMLGAESIDAGYVAHGLDPQQEKAGA